MGIWLKFAIPTATYYSFPFSNDAKHKKAQLFGYAPLPEDLHTVSNWSGTHEVQTHSFNQPENAQELEKVVVEGHERKAKITGVWRWIRRRRQARVEASIQVQQVVNGIKDYGIAEFCILQIAAD